MVHTQPMAVRPVWIAAVAVPVAAFAALLARPNVDKVWESHPAHFWTVLTAAGASVAVGWAVSSAGRRRRDARLFLVSLACLASAGFLGPARACDTGSAPRQERRLRARDAGRPRHRRRRSRRCRRSSSGQLGSDPDSPPRPVRARARRNGLPRLGRRLAGEAAAARRAARAGATRRLAACARRCRDRVLLARGVRLPPPLPAAEREVRHRGHGRLRAARRGDDRHRVGAQLACVAGGNGTC